MAKTQPEEITVKRASGYPVWRLLDNWARYGPDEDECNNGGVNCYFKTLDDSGALVCAQKLIWATDEEELAVLDMPGGVGYCYGADGKEIPYCLAVEMTSDSSYSPGPPPGRGEHGPYHAKISGNSDEVSGMGLPLRRHVQYTFTFQLVTSGEVPPDEPPPAEGEWVVKRQTADRIVLVRKT